MTAANNTSYDALLRELWPQDDIYDLLYEDAPFFAMVQKDTTFYEKIRHVALGYGTTQGVGADFPSAKANKVGSVNAEFKITPVTYYSLFSIQRQLLRRAGNKKAAILPALERESRMAMEAWKRDVQILLWGSGVGDIGRVAVGGVSTNTITLATTSDVRHFERNMTLDVSSDNTGVAGVRPVSSPLRITAVNRRTGVLTFSTNVTTAIPGTTSNDYLYRQGNYNAVVSSVPGWIPSSDPGATAWFGLDRSTDTLRLGGVRTTATGLSPRAAAMKVAKELGENGGRPTHYFLSPDDYLNLQMELQSAGTLNFMKEPGAPIDKWTFGTPFEGIQLMGPKGIIKCFFDINVPVGAGYMLQLDTWTFGSMGKVPGFDDSDGNQILREGDADAIEGRIVGDFQLWCEAPGKNARVAF